MSKKNFQASNLNFAAQAVIFLLGVLTLLGIEFPQSPEQLGPEIVTTLTGKNYAMVFSVMVISFLMPIWNWAKAKPNVKFISVVGSLNFWVYLVTFVSSVLALFQIPIPQSALHDLVVAVYDKDWSSVLNIAIVSILSPLFRWFKDKKTEAMAKLE